MFPNLDRPLIVFDLETTGLNLATDSIIQISYIKVQPDGSEKRNNQFVNPMKPIPQEVVALTGITDDMVIFAPTFKELAPSLQQEFQGCDFVGYNSNNFDIPMLCEEFLRAGIDFNFSKSRLIDACVIFKRMEQRNLAAAYKFYTGRKMEEDFQAHLADQDTEATWAVLKGELDMYAPSRQEEPERQIENSMDVLAALSAPKMRLLDFSGRLVMDENGNEVVNFGKYKGRLAKDVLPQDPGYVSWVKNGDFTLDTKRWFTYLQSKYAKR